MNPVQRFLEKCNGLHFKQDYLCLDQSTFQHPLQVYQVVNGRITHDLTSLHAFVGYSPMVFAMPSTPLIPADTIELAFTRRPFVPNGDFDKKDAVALLKLRKLQSIGQGEGRMEFYEGVHGWHRFVSTFHQRIISIGDRLYNRKPGNVFLPGNGLIQVQIAYSIPRRISLISVGVHDRFNLFPTDLHGKAGESHYLISLRHEGHAAAQVLKARRLLLSTIDVSHYRKVYSLGKNHMREPTQRGKLPFTTYNSTQFGLPVPEGCTNYYELELEDSVNIGIHRVFQFRIVNQAEVNNQKGILSHIHNTYATWRYNNHLPGNYILR